MSTRIFLSMAFGLSLATAACGGSVTDPSQAPGNAASAGGSSSTGAPSTNNSSSTACSGEELPACAKSETRFTSQGECAKSSTQCRAQTGCGTTIWCGKDDVCGDAPPQCGPGTMRYESCDGISPPLTCTSVTQCGFTIYCGPVHSVPVQIWPNDATQLVALDDGGGFAPAGPAGSTCSMGQAEFTFDRASRTLGWQTCDSETSSPWKMKAGQRTLTATEASNLETNMKGVVWSSQTSCGADKSVEKIRVKTPNGTFEYLDSFYACEKKGTYVDGLDAVFAALRALAQ